MCYTGEVTLQNEMVIILHLRYIPSLSSMTTRIVGIANVLGAAAVSAVIAAELVPIRDSVKSSDISNANLSIRMRV